MSAEALKARGEAMRRAARTAMDIAQVEINRASNRGDLFGVFIGSYNQYSRSHRVHIGGAMISASEGDYLTVAERIVYAAVTIIGTPIAIGVEMLEAPARRIR